LQPRTKTAIDQKRFVGAARVGLLQRGHVDGRGGSVRESTLSRVRLNRRTGRGVRRCIRSVRRVRPAIEAARSRTASASTSPRSETSRAKSSAPRREVADLQGEIDFSGARGDLHLTPLRCETEHGDIDGPRTRRQISELKFAIRIGQSAEDTLALSRTHGGSRQGLAFGFHHARLRQRHRKRAQKYHGKRQRPHVHCFDVREQPSGYIPECNNKARE